MIPNRSTLASWRVDGLLAAGDEIAKAGKRISATSWDAGARLLKLTNAKEWSGSAATAANDAFSRADTVGSHFDLLGETTNESVQQGSSSLTVSKHAIDRLVATIESGPLYVDNEWVVLLRPQAMSRAMARLMALAAQGFQDQLNPLVTAVGRADHDLAIELSKHLEGVSLWLSAADLESTAAPRDQVIDPSTTEGGDHQRLVRSVTMSETVAEKTVSDEGGKRITTVTMQDGTTQVFTHWEKYDAQWRTLPSGVQMPVFGGPPNGVPADQVEMFDSDGQRISTFTSWHGGYDLGIRSDKGWVNIARGSGGETLVFENGRSDNSRKVPDFFSHPYLATVGGGLSALETGAKEGGVIPHVSQDAVANIHAGAKFAGPALTLATAAYDVMAAQDAHDRCVAGVSAGVGAVGGYASGALAAAGGTALAGPAGAAAGAATGSTFGGFYFGYVGSRIGEAVCN
ncbi:hypothetical protein [Gordonia sp. DT101]|uniref:hypothetical protein n=1 Tax=Gordonia sp. DT101 TaxID=3416545 RepID=UPI003CF360DE